MALLGLQACKRPDRKAHAPIPSSQREPRLVLTATAPLTTTGCRKYSSTAAPRRADRSTPWKDGWYLQKVPAPHGKVTSSKRGKWGSLPSFLAGPCPAQVFQVLLRMSKKRQDILEKGRTHAGHTHQKLALVNCSM